VRRLLDVIVVLGIAALLVGLTRSQPQTQSNFGTFFFRERPSYADYSEFTFAIAGDGNWGATLLVGRKTLTAKGILTESELEQFWKGLEEAGAWQTQEEPGIPQATDQSTYDMVLKAPDCQEHILYCYGVDGHPNVTETLYFLNSGVVGSARTQLIGLQKQP
jgi:hypothetical protein